ncbi:MAG: pyridoxal phosphate-dependent aminotransferase [Thermoplasmata archaeon]
MVSERMRGVKGSPTVRLSGLVAELRARGENVISLAIGEPDFPTPAHIVEAAKKALDEGFTRYTPSRGIGELREAIAEKSQQENGIQCGPENVMVSPTKHALFAATLAFSGAGEDVLLPDPGWVSYLPMVQMANARPVPVPCVEEDGFEMTPEAVGERITPKARMIIVNTPNNPTGSVYDLESLKGIADLAEDHDLVIVTDEIYERILYGESHHSIASFPGAFERTVTINGFSKTYAMTGWRLGWAVAPGHLLDPMSTVQEHSITCATSFAQKGGVAALRGPEGPVEEMVRKFARRREVMVKGMNEIPGLSCQEPQGAFYAWVSYEDPIKSLDFSEMLLEKALVAVIPGGAFGDEGEGYIRLSFATSQDNVREALKRIREVLS